MKNKQVPLENKRVAVYCRVGTDDRHDTALERQAQSLREYAEAQDYVIIKNVQERGSGAAMNRMGVTAATVQDGNLCSLLPVLRKLP